MAAKYAQTEPGTSRPSPFEPSEWTDVDEVSFQFKFAL